MSSFIAALSARPDILLICGLGFGVLIMYFGLASSFAGPSNELRRMRSGVGPRSGAADILSRSDTDPTGIFKVFIPASRDERSRIAMRMRQAGIHRPGAVRNYYVVRGILGILLPSLVVAFMLLPTSVSQSLELAVPLGSLGWSQTFQLLAALLVAGFYGPSLWLKTRIDKRRKKVEQGLPNALDLLQVAIEAGMSFDAAMNRVAHEMARVVPSIAEEFMTVQLEIQAGMDRERAFLNLANRTGVEALSAFANVILQSAQFGSSISGALSTYSEDMRLTRELNAQEKANKLPVKMSGVMALMMMPTLLMITLAPVVIRWVNMVAESQ